MSGAKKTSDATGARPTRPEPAPQLLEDLATSIREVFFVVATDQSKMYYISPSYERVWGRTCESLYDDPSEWLAAVHPDDKAALLERMAAYAGDPDFEVEYRVVRPDGTHRWVRVRGIPIPDEEGRPGRLAGVAEDITEAREANESLRQSEEKLRRAIQHAPYPMVIHDEDDNVHLPNDAWIAQSGYTFDDVSSVTDWLEKAFGARQGLDKAAIDYLFENLKRFQWGEFQLRRKDGTLRIWDLSTAPLGITPEGKRLVVTMAVDVTERRQAEEDLRQARDELEARVAERTANLKDAYQRLETEIADRRDAELALRRSERLASIGTLAAGVAHEINNPLGLIALEADAALENLEDRSATESALREISNYVKRCGHIVEGVLRFAREERAERWLGSINDSVIRARDLTRETAQQHGVTVELDLCDEITPVVMNPTEIDQVLVNLIHNAIQACQRGGLVCISTHEVPSGVVIDVTDTGAGMSTEQRERAFDPFYTTRQGKGGTGLGLSTCHGIAIDHGGTIEIDCPRDGGTRVRMQLPHDIPQRSHGADLDS